jgi:hypothetical protein
VLSRTVQLDLQNDPQANISIHCGKPGIFSVTA